MSYGIIRAWKGASEYQRVEEFLGAVLETNTNYLENNCASDIEFIDFVDNKKLNGIVAFREYVQNKWNLGKGNFEVRDIELSYTDTSEVASFTVVINNKSFLGLAVIEESNGRISLCGLALSKDE